MSECVWCGSKGGFVNRLVPHIVGVNEVMYECEWCLATINYELKKMGAN
jgi:hypothetical protein